MTWQPAMITGEAPGRAVAVLLRVGCCPGAPMLEGSCSVLGGGLIAGAWGLGAGWVGVRGLELVGGWWWGPLSLIPPPLARDSVDLRLEELKPFIPPAWMTEKMQKHMETLRRGGDVPVPEGPPEP